MEKITQPTFKIVITGPESTGKSTLSRQLSDYFEQPWLPEYARVYLSTINRPYEREDLVQIAKGQMENEDEILRQDNPAIFVDTSLEVIKVWSEWKYKSCDSFILNSLASRKADLYLLLSPDIAWESDPMRENPDDRDLLFEIYKMELQALGKPFHVISGLGLNRTQQAIQVISKHVNTKA